MIKRAIAFTALLLTDLIALILSFYLAYYIRLEVIQDLFNVANPWFFPLNHFYNMYYLLFVFILIFSYEKLYSYNRRYDFLEEFIYIVRGLFMSVVLIVVLVYLSRSFESFTRTIPVLMLMTGTVIVPLFRFLIRKILTSTGIYTRHAALLGKPNETEPVLAILKNIEKSGCLIDHVIEPDQRPDNMSFDLLIIVPHGMKGEELNECINFWETKIKEIKIVSDSSYLKTIGVETEYIDQLLLMRMANQLLSPANRFFKRTFDLLVSILSLILLCPLFLLIALAIKLDSRGNVLFKQERYGKDGKPFRFYKFRTMYRDGDEKLTEFLKQNPHLQEEWDRYKKLKTYDPRVTRVGKFLRRFSLDESPQLINVLLGEMSIVGPRPYLPREKDDIQQSAAIIFRVQSGITGLWQIKGRNDLSFQDRLKLDEFYVRNWSFLLDITIILKTFGTVLKGKGAY